MDSRSEAKLDYSNPRRVASQRQALIQNRIPVCSDLQTYGRASRLPGLPLDYKFNRAIPIPAR
jgi:hypothetical protein